jgi:hypothetical protein
MIEFNSRSMIRRPTTEFKVRRYYDAVGFKGRRFLTDMTVYQKFTVHLREGDTQIGQEWRPLPAEDSWPGMYDR